MAEATANAAHSKLESSSMSIPSSSCTCTYNAPTLVTSSATCRQSGPMILSILKSLLQLFFQYVPTIIHMLPSKHHKVEYATLRSSCPEPLWNNDGNPRIHNSSTMDQIKVKPFLLLHIMGMYTIIQWAHWWVAGPWHGQLLSLFLPILDLHVVNVGSANISYTFRCSHSGPSQNQLPNLPFPLSKNFRLTDIGHADGQTILHLLIRAVWECQSQLTITVV